MKEFLWERFNVAISGEDMLRCCEVYAKLLEAENNIRLAVALREKAEVAVNE
jgi:hypothetical protein